MNVVFLNRFFYPDHSATSQMLSDLAFAIAARGRSVAVLASRQCYEAPDARLPARETVHGVAVHRVWTSRFGRKNLVLRAIDYATFYAAAGWTLFRLARRGDIVVAMTDPPMLSVVAAPVAWARRARLVNWLQDLFPEVAEALDLGGGATRIAYKVLRALRTRSLRGAANVVLGKRMAERVATQGVAEEQIHVIPNWADGAAVVPIPREANPLRAAWGLGNAFVVGYSGNFGRAHEMETVLGAIEAIERLGSTRGDFLWLFVGGGPLRDRLRHEVERRGLVSARFKPYQPRERLAESLSAADAHLVSLRPELEGLIVPSKFYGVAAAGRPVLFIGDGDGEIARLVVRAGCGLTIAPGCSQDLARAVVALAETPGKARAMGRAARDLFESECDMGTAVARWDALIAALAPPPP